MAAFGAGPLAPGAEPLAAFPDDAATGLTVLEVLLQLFSSDDFLLATTVAITIDIIRILNKTFPILN